MSLFHRHHYDSLNDVFVDQLRDLYDAEHKQCETQSKLADAADAPQLQAMFRQQDEEAHEQIVRLETAFRELGLEPKRDSCEAMDGLIKETEEVVSAEGNPHVRDAALIASVQRIKHYEIAGYGTARTFAEELGHPQVAALLQQSLEEESRADERFSDLAIQQVNPRAIGVSPGRERGFDGGASSAPH